MNRLVKVAKLHTVQAPMLVLWPTVITVASFVIAFTIFVLVGDKPAEPNISGGVFTMYAFELGFYLQAMTQTLPFALGLSVTRREFFVATAGVALAAAVAIGSVLFALSLVERATGYWGVNMRMFDIAGMFTPNPLLQWLCIVTSLLLLAALGVLLGAIQQRWRATGLYILAIAAVLALGGASIVVTWQQWWTGIGRWFTDIPRALPVTLFPAALAAALLAIAWTALRRAPA